jgi:hypothetical protein
MSLSSTKEEIFIITVIDVVPVNKAISSSASLLRISKFFGRKLRAILGGRKE